MRIGLIGCGKVGITACWLIKEKHKIAGVYDIVKKNQRKAAKLLKIKTNLAYDLMVKNSDLLFIATPDDEIIKAYKKAAKFILKPTYIYHFSGLLPAEIIPRSKYVARASIHPFASFPKLVIPPEKMPYLLFVQGDPKALKIADKVFPRMHFNLKTIKRKEKSLYHLVGVFSNNFIVALAQAVWEIMTKLKWNEKDFLNIVLPMMEDTVSNLKRYGIKQALSGPLRRGDIETIAKHLKSLKENKRLLGTYTALSAHILKYTERKDQKSKIKTLLNRT